MKFGVKVLPRKQVLDTQGRAVEQTLQGQGFDGVQCRVGKYIEHELDASSHEEAEKKVKSVAEYVLYNPLIEDFEIVKGE